MKREKTSGGGKSASAPAPRQATRTAADYDREQESLYDEMRSYIDQRLQNMGAPPPPPRRSLEAAQDPKAEGDAAPKDSWVKTLLEWRPEVYLLLVLLLMGGMYRKLQTPPAASERDTRSVETQTETDTRMAAPSASPADHDRRDLPAGPDPVAQWKSLVDEQPRLAAEWFRAVAAHTGLEAGQVSDRQRKSFGDFAAKLDTGGFLKDEEISQAATGLFEYVHARWARDSGIGDSKRDVVTLDPSEAANHLVQLGTALGLTTIDAASKPQDAKVQAVVVLRWMELHPKP